MKNTDPNVTFSTIALALTSAVLVVANPLPAEFEPALAVQALAATTTPVEGRKDEPTMKARHSDDATTERIVLLQTEEVVRVGGSARLRVAHGTVWLTIDGKPDDHMLRPGDRFTLERGDRALLQALRAPASVVVAEAAPSWAGRVARSLQVATLRLAGMAS